MSAMWARRDEGARKDENGGRGDVTAVRLDDGGGPRGDSAGSAGGVPEGECGDLDRIYCLRGRPVEAPWRMVVVTVLQYIEGLSDRQAADAVRAH